MPSVVNNTGVPVGTSAPYEGGTVPAGWLLCDGSSLLRATYVALFNQIGTAHGTVDGTHFNLPDHRGRFLRGVDHGAGVDPNAGTRTAPTGGNAGDNVGSLQTDAFQGHLHGWTAGAPPNFNPAANAPNSGIFALHTGGATTDLNSTISDGSHGTPRTSSESRPINAYVNYMIKAY